MLATRDLVESLENAQLAPYAQHSAATLGRHYEEPEHAYRAAYQRDRDRILHTTAFRRLEYKTQVFVNHEGDHYRTRLTHTLEVSQIARTMARTLRLNEDLAEAIALAHDLGHTPFGHAGERTLQEKMRAFGGFNHNTHGLRIVEQLEERYPGFPGLNLTHEVREGIVKHATAYDTPEASLFGPDQRATLEGQLINVADEIAYNTHDLDDGLRSELFQPDDLRGLALWDEALHALEIPQGSLSSLDRNRIIRHLINVEVTDVLVTAIAHLEALQPRSVEDVRRQSEDLIRFSPALHEKNAELEGFLMDHLYRHWRVMRMTGKARRMLADLFDAFADNPKELLPESARERMAKDGVPRVVCDYIAGMTDRFALQEHHKVFDPEERV
ncbi:MAG: deoxyguanosinetriphosphate triphosphohydrolase [Anaerolineae bacterium]